MTQSLEVTTKEFCVQWPMQGHEGGQVRFTLSGQVSLLDGKRFYKIDGVLYISEGSTYCREIGNPRLYVRRNGVEASGRQWGWETISSRRTANRLCTMDGYFVRTGYWAPADRAIQLGIVAESGFNRRKSHSPTATLRLVD
ncbi:hypothetical protein [Amycolatopsis sp. PS_44_ISF1]|uniref:hypothetical protein n=1 Tax=Amycolatopsis sp. PS_44_ISF1 TaxID=2974917 RepID=UPI0028DDB94F|nr:hypothetical protein [Amycolatopsis sp. PS_44_ISF1]MDT8911819.1 hypothetical protein [Amycolatopsis sp. PS_44_ISF1]